MSVRGIGLLGLGSVGAGVLELVRQNLWESYEVVAAGVRDTSKPRPVAFPNLATNLLEVVDSPEVEVVVEVMGGVEPALSLIKRAMSLGKPVVTANKELVAKRYDELMAFGGAFRFEAAVGGGVPIIQTLSTLARSNRVQSIQGIVNGTTNFILTEMLARGAGFDEMLAEAQALGYAEADPTDDVDGFDALHKIAILAAIATGEQQCLERASRSGVRGVSLSQLQMADRAGKRVKLIASWTPEDGIAVAPAALPLSHPLARVDGVFNGISVTGDFVGELTLVGLGAGSHPTASAICGDLVQLLG